MDYPDHKIRIGAILNLSIPHVRSSAFLLDALHAFTTSLASWTMAIGTINSVTPREADRHGKDVTEHPS